MLKNILVILNIFIVSLNAWSWGELGHGAVGFIAEKNLTLEAKKMVQDIIGVEPLAVAANWPDLVRSDVRFKEYSPYHYTDSGAEKDAKTIIEQVPGRILDKKISREEKMIWLRYLIHVIGDLHQPLHVGNGFDRGGNDCQVKWMPVDRSKIERTNLHTFWDEKIISFIEKDYNKKNPRPIGQKRWFDYVDLTEILLADTDVTMKSANKVKPADWYEEAKSYHAQIYPDPKPVKDPKERIYCKTGNFKMDKVPLISEDYINKNLPLAKKQLVKAGYRLAQFLNDMGVQYAQKASKTEIIEPKDLLLKNSKPAEAAK